MTDPILRFNEWWQEVKNTPAIIEPTAMALATATPSAAPSVRIVLLKDCDAKGFTFFTNAESRKGDELKANPQAALCFYWMPLKRQVRVEGRIEKVSDEESDAYYSTRARGSQIGAWASIQSRPLDARETFEKRIAEFTEKFEGQIVPRPAHWHGWRLVPTVIEFWTERPFRLHDREIYTRNAQNDWDISRLYP